MSARTDRIAKLNSKIEECIAKGFPNKQAKFTEMRDEFAGWTDDHYDYTMALCAAKLANPDLSAVAFAKTYYAKTEA
jgi:hypothetical protein